MPLRAFHMRMVVAVAALWGALSWSGAALAQAPGDGGAEVWDLSQPSAPRHWFTGLRCWDRAGDAMFVRRVAFIASGADVGCIYESRDLSVTVYATRRANDDPIAASITSTRGQVASRYRGAATVLDRQRALVATTGPLEVDEFVLAVDGQDLQLNRSMSGATGAWHADLAGWTLKVRLTSHVRIDPRALSILADTLLSRAAADMQTAHECAGAGRGVAPTLNISGEEAVQVQVGVGVLGVTVSEAIPANVAAARAAGYVCLGETLNSRGGRQAVAVMQRPAAQNAPTVDSMTVTILAIGEIRGNDTTMAAIVDASMNPFAVEGQRGDRGHFAFSRSGDGGAGFYGALERGEPRLTAAQLAAHVADGGAAMVTIGGGQQR